MDSWECIVTELGIKPGAGDVLEGKKKKICYRGTNYPSNVDNGPDEKSSEGWHFDLPSGDHWWPYEKKFLWSSGKKAYFRWAWERLGGEVLNLDISFKNFCSEEKKKLTYSKNGDEDLGEFSLRWENFVYADGNDTGEREKAKLKMHFPWREAGPVYEYRLFNYENKRENNT